MKEADDILIKEAVESKFGIERVQRSAKKQSLVKVNTKK